MTNKWAAAVVLLGVCLVFSAAGIQALSASYSETTSTRNASADYADRSPPVLDTGRQMGGTLATLLPPLAYVGVPMGILGIVSLGGIAYLTNQSSGGLNR